MRAGGAPGCSSRTLRACAQVPLRTPHPATPWLACLPRRAEINTSFEAFTDEGLERHVSAAVVRFAAARRCRFEGVRATTTHAHTARPPPPLPAQKPKLEVVLVKSPEFDAIIAEQKEAAAAKKAAAAQADPAAEVLEQ